MRSSLGFATILLSWATVLSAAFELPTRVLKVGPGGTHATIQSALNAAVPGGGASEVRVAAGIYVERLTIPATFTSGSIKLLGGWNGSFVSRSEDPAATKIDGSGQDSVIKIEAKGGSVHIEGFSIANGRSYAGGGISALIQQGGSLVLLNNVISGNAVSSDSGSADGGGIDINATSCPIEVRNNIISNNTARGTTVNGVGMNVYLSDSAITISGNTFSGNVGTAVISQVSGAGLVLACRDASGGEVINNTFKDNSGTPQAGYLVVGSGAAFGIASTGILRIAGNSWINNKGNSDQVNITGTENSQILLFDSVIARGQGQAGVGVLANDTVHVDITNCTVVGNTTSSVFKMGNGKLSVYNSILYGNGTNAPESVVETGGNLIGADPRFINSNVDDYRLLPDSPAIDAGLMSTPTGLSTTDRTGALRVIGASVDIGAFERQEPTPLFVPSVAHTTGYGGTPWRTAFGLVNATNSEVDVDLRLRAAGGIDRQKKETLAPFEAKTWNDVLVSLFGIGSEEKVSGAVEVTPGSPGVAAMARTYADAGATGTYGQHYPAVSGRQLLTRGTLAYLPLVKKNDRFYTNVGVQNSSDLSATVKITLKNADGITLGSTVNITAPPRMWAQQPDIFKATVAPNTDVAYALAELVSDNTAVWVYASVVDSSTKDPTTVPFVFAAPANAVLHVPSVAHSSGYLGTPWRTSLAIVNGESYVATVKLVYLAAGIEKSAETFVPGSGVVEWNDILVQLFGYGPDAQTGGVIEVSSPQRLAVITRTYADRGAEGTYGQYYPALLASDALTPQVPAVLPLLANNASFYTNIGVQNLGSTPCTYRIRLYAGDDLLLGVPVTRTVDPRMWSQVSDVFTKAVAGQADNAYALVDTSEPDCKAWFYASVVDQLTRDPTTIPVVPVFGWAQ